MKAIRFHEYGDPDVLRLRGRRPARPRRRAGAVRVAATSFNPVDAGIRGGYLQGPFPVTLPHIPGIDVAGTVDALGEGVDAVAVGDAVIGFLPMVADGAAAEYVIAPAEILAPAPTSIPLADAAALPMVGLTAWQALFDDAGLTAGQRVLINGAGGAVGGYAVQLAKRAGAHVIATASPRSRERVRSAGADEIIDHTATEVTAAVTEPVDVLLNLAPIAPRSWSRWPPWSRAGGVVVNTVPTIRRPGDEERGVRAIGVFVRSDADQLVAAGRRWSTAASCASTSPSASRWPSCPRSTPRAPRATLAGKVVVLPGASVNLPVELGGKEHGRPETDEPDPGEHAHRDPVRPIPGGDGGHQNRPGDRGAERRAQVGHAAREARDLALELLGEARLNDVHRRGQHRTQAEADEEQPGHERPDGQRALDESDQEPDPDQRDHEARHDQGSLRPPLGESHVLRGTRSRCPPWRR